MWANEEVIELAEWLREHNRQLSDDPRIGFYGLDVYSLWDSLYAVMGYLRRVDPDSLPAAWRAYRCFEPYGEDVQGYAAASQFVPDSCEEEVIDLLHDLRRKVRLVGRSRQHPGRHRHAHRHRGDDVAPRREAHALFVRRAAALARDRADFTKVRARSVSSRRPCRIAASSERPCVS